MSWVYFFTSLFDASLMGSFPVAKKAPSLSQAPLTLRLCTWGLLHLDYPSSSIEMHLLFTALLKIQMQCLYRIFLKSICFPFSWWENLKTAPHMWSWFSSVLVYFNFVLFCKCFQGEGWEVRVEIITTAPSPPLSVSFALLLVACGTGLVPWLSTYSLNWSSGTGQCLSCVERTGNTVS